MSLSKSQKQNRLGKILKKLSPPKNETLAEDIEEAIIFDWQQKVKKNQPVSLVQAINNKKKASTSLLSPINVFFLSPYFKITRKLAVLSLTLLLISGILTVYAPRAANKYLAYPDRMLAYSADKMSDISAFFNCSAEIKPNGLALANSVDKEYLSSYIKNNQEKLKAGSIDGRFILVGPDLQGRVAGAEEKFQDSSCLPKRIIDFIKDSFSIK
ncbi:MAG: hypothetical protein U9R06_02820 [Patescibacteria group bacterium]|nr:hypothetical protein [Patescibacteria group bacterium]